MSRYAFWVRRPSGMDLVYRCDDPRPVAALRAIVDDELDEIAGQPGMWATPDRQTTVERFNWLWFIGQIDDSLGNVLSVRRVSA
jgi:hypothetical protein